MDLHGTAQECFFLSRDAGKWDDIEEYNPSLNAIHERIDEVKKALDMCMGSAEILISQGRDLREITYRKNKPVGFAPEIGAVICLLFDLAVGSGVDIDTAVSENINYMRFLRDGKV